MTTSTFDSRRKANQLPNAFSARFNLGENLKLKLAIEKCPLVQSARDVARIFHDMAHLEREIMTVGTVDSQSRMIFWTMLATGSSEQLFMRTGDAFIDAIRMCASGIFLVHNHPSGSLAPSKADIQLTHKVREAGLLLGFPLLDHVIISTQGFRSLMKPSKVGDVTSRFADPIAQQEKAADSKRIVGRNRM